MIFPGGRMLLALAWETTVDPMCDWSIQLAVHPVYSMLCELNCSSVYVFCHDKADIQNLVGRSAIKSEKLNFIEIIWARV